MRVISVIYRTVVDNWLKFRAESKKSSTLFRCKFLSETKLAAITYDLLASNLLTSRPPTNSPTIPVPLCDPGVSSAPSNGSGLVRLNHWWNGTTGCVGSTCRFCALHNPLRRPTGHISSFLAVPSGENRSGALDKSSFDGKISYRKCCRHKRMYRIHQCYSSSRTSFELVIITIKKVFILSYGRRERERASFQKHMTITTNKWF